MAKNNNSTNDSGRSYVLPAIAAGVMIVGSAIAARADNSYKADPRLSPDSSAASSAAFYADNRVSLSQKMANVAEKYGKQKDDLGNDGLPVRKFRLDRKYTTEEGQEVSERTYLADSPDSAGSIDYLLVVRGAVVRNKDRSTTKVTVYVDDRGLDGVDGGFAEFQEVNTYTGNPIGEARKEALSGDKAKKIYANAVRAWLGNRYDIAMKQQRELEKMLGEQERGRIKKEKEEEKKKKEQGEKDRRAIDSLF